MQLDRSSILPTSLKKFFSTRSNVLIIDQTKFALATLAMFTIVGLFLFGFSLKDMANELSSAQSGLTEAERDLVLVQARMEKDLSKLSQAEEDLVKLQRSTEEIKIQVEAAFQKISQREADSKVLMLAIETRSGRSMTTTISSDTIEGRGKLVEARRNQTKLWENGTRLRVAFLDGEEDLHQLVMDTAPEWARNANLEFDFGAAAQEADIRITFELYGGFWSYVGTGALDIPTAKPTMNIDPSWGPDTDLLKPRVLKNFGHAIGLLNEHQNPNADIPWDKEAVYEKYTDGPQYFGSKERVDEAFFSTWKPRSFPIDKEYDKLSVMHQQVPNELTTGDFEVSATKVLSEGDKAWITELYPGQ